MDEFRAALQKAGKSAEIYTYPGAGHAFMHDGVESYRPDAARQAWARMHPRSDDGTIGHSTIPNLSTKPAA